MEGTGVKRSGVVVVALEGMVVAVDIPWLDDVGDRSAANVLLPLALALLPALLPALLLLPLLLRLPHLVWLLLTTTVVGTPACNKECLSNK